MKKKIHSISALEEKLYDSYIKKYSLKDVRSLGGENTKIKNLRYKIIIDELLLLKHKKIKILDCGCGKGDLYQFLKNEKLDVIIDYEGTEVNQAMLNFCKLRFGDNKKFYLADVLELPIKKKYDFIIFSGTFYHKPRKINKKIFFKYVKDVICKSFTLSKCGVIFNFINEDVDYRKPHLFYPRYKDINLFIKSLTRFSKKISNYPLYESSYICFRYKYLQQRYFQKQFSRYFSNK